jgi:hypothetical protein
MAGLSLAEVMGCGLAEYCDLAGYSVKIQIGGSIAKF